MIHHFTHSFPWNSNFLFMLSIPLSLLCLSVLLPLLFFFQPLAMQTLCPSHLTTFLLLLNCPMTSLLPLSFCLIWQKSGELSFGYSFHRLLIIALSCWHQWCSMGARWWHSGARWWHSVGGGAGECELSSRKWYGGWHFHAVLQTWLNNFISPYLNRKLCRSIFHQY